MPRLAVQLLSPADDGVLLGTQAAALRAALPAPPAVPLFARWYSSAAADPLGSALELPAVVLPPGSQLITVGVKDQADDTPAALQAVLHAGSAGGPPEGGTPCRVHVLRAMILEPAPGATLARGGATLACEAPPMWSRKLPPAVVYELNPDYHAINKLRFRWRFTPSGNPPGRASGELMPAPADWSFVPPANAGERARLRYSGPLPAGLGTGAYVLTLRVEHADRPAQGHEHAFGVQLS